MTTFDKMSADWHRRVAAALAPSGLILRGAFHVVDEDAVPVCPDGRRVRTIALVGNAGPAMWRVFSATDRIGSAPLDTWTASTVSAIAGDLSAGCLFPFDGPPYWPFQRWAQRADTVWPSPLGVLIHPEYGLWHAYRAALLFADRLPLPDRAAAASPCDTCADQPCRTTCPVGAIRPHGYDVVGCRAHVAGTGRECRQTGCLARHACPVGRDYAYAPDQAAFHMSAFVGVASD